MTKEQLMEAMDGLDDDAEIHVYCTSMNGGVYASSAYIEDIVSGDDVQNELTIVAHF